MFGHPFSHHLPCFKPSVLLLMLFCVFVDVSTKRKSGPCAFCTFCTLGHLCFLEVLLILSAVYVAYCRASRPSSNAKQAFPGTAAILTFIAAIALISFVVRIWAPEGKLLPATRFVRALSVLLSFAISHYVIRRLPYAKYILG
jgi:hypothetical protein